MDRACVGPSLIASSYAAAHVPGLALPKQELDGWLKYGAPIA